jgi:hypothetical protein
LFWAPARDEFTFVRRRSQDKTRIRQIPVWCPLIILDRWQQVRSFFWPLNSYPFLDRGYPARGPSKQFRKETKRLSKISIDWRLRHDSQLANASDWNKRLHCERPNNIVIAPTRSVWV